MGQYSYSQPSSSSEELDITSLLEAEAQLYADEGQSSFHMPEAVQYQPQPEADDGIPTICYCGAEPVIATAYTDKDRGRMYFSCVNADDGDCHIWKWWDVAIMEEMREFQSMLRRLKEEGEDVTGEEEKKSREKRRSHGGESSHGWSFFVAHVKKSRG
ncbi:uncharacterized protein LOC130495033 [Raphanus sativus]|uniref:Uncharacterized protein LOC130495033 n=1 Tax=Raphanus sativus TaxID=3726 RepID=A0A9W3BRT9_RAPSA|nr:uncharacterized protein LOC130495033 [Raphanus sativus]